jgi:glyoxylase-like metal-dependent hydrolase (beta-lactamase superfamily II)
MFETGKLFIQVGHKLMEPSFRFTMGTARCDFPEGSVESLYTSIQRLYNELPDGTRVFVGHDYAPGGREIAWETTIGKSKE